VNAKRRRARSLPLAPILVSLILAAAQPSHAAEPFALSYGLEAQGDYAAAAKLLEPLAKAGDDFAGLRIGWLAYLQGQHDQSERAYAVVIDRNPRAIEARLGRMLPLMAKKRWDDAISEGQAVLGQSQWNYTAHLRLLACEQAIGEWVLLDRHATQLAEAFPSDPDVLIYRARARERAGDKTAAKEIYAQVLERAPENPEAIAQLQKLP